MIGELEPSSAVHTGHTAGAAEARLDLSETTWTREVCPLRCPNRGLPSPSRQARLHLELCSSQSMDSAGHKQQMTL